MLELIASVQPYDGAPEDAFIDRDYVADKLWLIGTVVTVELMRIYRYGRLSGVEAVALPTD